MVEQISETDKAKRDDRFVAYIRKSTSRGEVNLKFTAKLNSGFKKLKGNLREVDFSKIFNITLIPDET